MLNSLGDLIKDLRNQKRFSQADLGKIVGVSQSHIFRIEKGDIDKPSAQLIEKLANALDIDLHTLMKATIDGYVEQKESPDKLLARLQLSMPIAIPVVASIHAGPQEALDYAYWARSKDAKNLKALLVKGYCMSPLIEEGDVIIVDPDADPSEGKILVCYNDGEIFLRKYGEHHDCSHIYGVIIGVNRRL